MVVGVTTIEVSDGELVQLAMGRIIPISISALNNERSNIDGLQDFRLAPAPPPCGKVAHSFPPSIVYPKVAKAANLKAPFSFGIKTVNKLAPPAAALAHAGFAAPART
jgi:hypothetical protein